MSVEKKVPKCIAVTSTCNEAATDAIWTWSHLGCKSHVEHVLDTENSKFSWQGTVFNFTLEVRGDLCWQLHLIHWWEEVGKMSKATFKYFFYNYNFYYLMFFCCYYYFCYSVIHPLVLNLIDTGMEATRWETWLKNAAAPNKSKGHDAMTKQINSKTNREIENWDWRRGRKVKGQLGEEKRVRRLRRWTRGEVGSGRAEMDGKKQWVGRWLSPWLPPTLSTSLNLFPNNQLHKTWHLSAHRTTSCHPHWYFRRVHIWVGVLISGWMALIAELCLNGGNLRTKAEVGPHNQQPHMQQKSNKNTNRKQYLS